MKKRTNYSKNKSMRKLTIQEFTNLLVTLYLQIRTMTDAGVYENGATMPILFSASVDKNIRISANYNGHKYRDDFKSWMLWIDHTDEDKFFGLIGVEIRLTDDSFKFKEKNDLFYMYEYYSELYNYYHNKPNQLKPLKDMGL